MHRAALTLSCRRRRGIDNYAYSDTSVNCHVISSPSARPHFVFFQMYVSTMVESTTYEETSYV